MEWLPSFFSLKVFSQSGGYFTVLLPPSNYWQANQDAKNKTTIGNGAMPRESLLSEGENPGWPAISIWEDLVMFLNILDRCMGTGMSQNAPGIVRYLI